MKNTCDIRTYEYSPWFLKYSLQNFILKDVTFLMHPYICILGLYNYPSWEADLCLWLLGPQVFVTLVLFVEEES